MRLRWPDPLRAAEDPGADREPADGEALLDQIAAAVVRRELVMPAVFFLELNRPLAFLAGQATYVLVPFLAPLVGIGRMQEVARMLNDPTSIDRLLERIERLRSTLVPEEEGPVTA
jgi:hypothetical protein